MKKQNVLNLIKYHVEKNESGFRNEAINIARYFDSIGDDQLAEYIMGLIAESNLYAPQSSDFESEFQMALINRKINPGLETLFLPTSEEHLYLSSSVVKEIGMLGGDISPFVPCEILEDVEKRLVRGE